jgi:ribosomal protein S18 acetylase RimI-like enzyme
VSELSWLGPDPGPDEHDAVHRVVGAVTREGGVVGWAGAPDRAETEQWLAGIAAEIAAGRTRLALLAAGGEAVALGRWTRYAKQTVAVNGEILQVMVHPDARGQGLARRLVGALVADARARGVETLTLDVRGNNHAAMALYESVGFVAYGRLPDFVAVGADRWDRVLYRLDLRTAASPVRRHGSRPVGAGASTVRSSKRRGCP